LVKGKPHKIKEMEKTHSARKEAKRVGEKDQAHLSREKGRIVQER